jgi:hypothetical protein
MKSHRSPRGTAPRLSHVALASLACSLALTGAAQARGGAPKAVKLADTIPPTFTFSVAPMANVHGWNNTDVTITVTATDNPGGSGIFFIKDIITNAGVLLPGTTVNATTATFVINTEGVNTVLLRVQDVAGNRAEQTLTLSIDKTAPIITGARTAPNANGWNNGDVTATFTATDAGSGIDTVSGPTTLTGEGAGQSVTGTATDLAGNSASTTVDGINIDKTPPTCSFGSPSPAPGSGGWNNTDVSFPFTAGDALSGVDTTSPVSPLVLTAEGSSVTGTVTVTDKAGNSATFTSPACKIDKTPPTLIWGAPSPAPNGNGWNNSPVTLSYTASDAVSGVKTTSPRSPLRFSVEGAGQTFTVTATDKAGNSATFTSPAFNIDMTPPTIAITPANGSGPYDICGLIPPTFTTADALSGLDPSFPGMLATVAPTLSGVGSVTTSVTGVQDLAGNVASASSTYSVIYGPNAFVLASPFKSGAFTTKGTKVRVRFGLCPDPITGASLITNASCWLERAVDHVNLGTIDFDPLGLDYRLDVLGLNTWPRGSYQLLIHLDDGSIHPITLTLN